MLCVLIDGKHAGDIEFHRRRATLRYMPGYIRDSAVPLSSRFPLAGLEASGPELRNWLLNLLPDDESVLNHLRSEFGVVGRDPLRLLETPMGADCAGAVQFCGPEDVADLLASKGGEHPITNDEIAEWLRDYPVLPASMDGTRRDFHVGFSLAGMLIYHWLIANNDAHAKNYSWLFAPDGSPELSPLYDACSWLPYRGNRQVQRIPLAMKMGEGFNLKTCDKEAGLVGLAEKLSRSRSEVCERAIELANGLPAAMDATVDRLPGIAVDPQRIESHVEELRGRAQKCGRLAQTTLRARPHDQL